MPDVGQREAKQSAREVLYDAIRVGKPKVPEAVVIANEAGRGAARIATPGPS